MRDYDEKTDVADFVNLYVVYQEKYQFLRLLLLGCKDLLLIICIIMRKE